MISTTCHVASKFAITGILSLCFFREAVIRPAQRDRTASAGRIVASGCLSTVILLMAAHRTASKILRGEIGISSAGENPIDAVPTVTACDNTTTNLPISSLHVPDSIPNITIDLPFPSTPVPDSTSPSDIAMPAVDLSNSSTCISPPTPHEITPIDLSTSSEYVSPPSPHNITIIDLPDLDNCNRLSLTSDTTLVARDDDDDLKFADKASSTKEVESSGNERTFQEANERAPARAAHGCRVDTLSPITTVTKLRPLFLVNKFRTTTTTLRPLFLVNKFRTTTTTLRPLFLVNKFRTTISHTITDHSLPGSTHLTNASLLTLPVVDQFQTASSTIPNPSFPGPAHWIEANAPLPPFLRPANVNSSLTGSACLLAQKTKAAASWLKPLILVTKHAAGRPTPPLAGYQPEKARPHKLEPQKPKPRASRSNAARDSIVQSRLRRHTKRIVGHLALVCEEIRTGQADLMNVWVATMAEVGFTSTLSGNHQTSLGSPFPPIVDAISVPEPGLRIKDRLASLRQRTIAVAATIPATTTTTAPSSAWRCTP
ncbi:hypothetical protein DEU56DRAFT_914480 [Suillus clintonianus]|uniref:uncharacterized protein n=1 Tax=Suillus clintonianus TaxID=1904413 RepID=UPI001B87B950|nr:uncharacterized protein DEU56DRAFT_914480 [Suillus clintonianus]KAG2131331.1 hypothetical protein DEU56DRAFT_914480 [Suillus clintonianus]